VGTPARRDRAGTAGTRRARFIAALTFYLLTLAAGSTPRRVGDGTEYFAMALNLSAFNGPAISPEQMPVIERRLGSLGCTFTGIPLTNPGLQSADGRQDFVHFWFHSLLAVPFVWIVQAIGLHTNVAFTLLGGMTDGASITVDTTSPMRVRLVDLDRGEDDWSASTSVTQRDWTLRLPPNHRQAVLVFSSP
jgi:hypothetical protein